MARNAQMNEGGPARTLKKGGTQKKERGALPENKRGTRSGRVKVHVPIASLLAHFQLNNIRRAPGEQLRNERQRRAS